ncbi:MAG: SAM-dependent methyltransferase, partial [Lachnospiraceae bacterium]|nr:SAM-dependent methyltransferase [Lachnospiraceae bacterium]
MAKLNLYYYSGENHYSDGDIEEDILRIAREGKSLKDLESVEFPVLYHLSAVRENILNWYPFDKEGTCLEIG